MTDKKVNVDVKTDPQGGKNVTKVEMKDGESDHNKQLQVYLAGMEEHNMNLPTPEEIATAELWQVNGRLITICANASMQTKALCDWDTALTLSGAYVYTPAHTAIDGLPTGELDLADFVQNKKIDKGDAVIILTNSLGMIDEFMIPWIMYAFSQGKKVYVNTKLRTIDRKDGEKTVVDLIRVNTIALLRPHYLYHVSRDDIENHIRYKQRYDAAQAEDKLLEG